MKSMQANELRIGNIVRRKDNLQNDKGTEPVTVINIHEQGINKGEAFEHFIDNIEGILITEEWLQKFGFEETPFENTYTIKNWFYDLEDNSLLYDDETPISSVPTKHVHQLQNLYFALTSEELTLK